MAIMAQPLVVEQSRAIPVAPADLFAGMVAMPLTVASSDELVR
jgi:hypothetical protein